MKNFKKWLAMVVMAFGVGMSGGAQAGIPVIDGTHILNQAMWWATQYHQMVEQYEQLVKTYDSLNGARGMANLVNNPALRKYLPTNYQDILNNGYGNWEQIRATAKVVGLEDTHIGAGTDTGKLFTANARETAINRATVEDAYKKASERFDAIQVLLDKVNAAPDAKDMADLQGRIQAEQVMMENERIKLSMLAQMQDVQRRLMDQAAVEIRIKSANGPMPRGW